MSDATQKGLKDLGIETGSSIIGAGAGLILAGTPGIIIGSIISPVASHLLKKALSEKERDRISFVYEQAKQKIKEKIKQGAGLRKDLDPKKMKEIIEGTLLKAKDCYEEKKLPLIANLIAVAPFTNTPIENLNQTLITTEQLSYQQLCILAIVDRNHYPNPFPLSDKPFTQKHNLQYDERVEGIYHDIFAMIKSGILTQIPQNGAISLMNINNAAYIVPAYLLLEYPGRLLCNGLSLASISKDEIKPILDILEK